MVTILTRSHPKTAHLSDLGVMLKFLSLEYQLYASRHLLRGTCGIILRMP